MLEKFLGDFRETLEILYHCQVQATAVIWEEPIYGAAPKSGGGELPPCPMLATALSLIRLLDST